MKSIGAVLFASIIGILVAGPRADADIINARSETFNSGALQAWLDSTPAGASEPSGIDAVNDQLENAIFQAGIDLAATSTIMLFGSGLSAEFSLWRERNGGSSRRRAQQLR